MRGLLVAFALCAVASAALTEDDMRTAFFAYVKQYGKEYPRGTESARYEAFKYNLQLISAHNNDASNTYEMGINAFSDLMPEEFAARFTTLAEAEDLAMTMIWLDDSNDIDWRSKGAISPVKNQGQCGAAGAFAGLETVQAWDFIKTGNRKDLSIQQIIDCATGQGCTGGFPDGAFEYIKANGSCTTADYGSYTQRKGACKIGCKPAVHIPGWQKSQSENTLQTLLDKAPVSVLVDATGFQHYRSGIFSGPCGKQLNHAVTAVGYQSAKGSEPAYWILKNTWGASWGAQGYIYLKRGQDLCGVSQHIVSVKDS